MNDDLISREALRREIKKECNSYGTTIDFESCKRVLDIIDNAPTGGLKQGVWIEQKNYPYQRCNLQLGYECNQCGTENTHKTNFCPNCGAKMKGGAK